MRYRDMTPAQQGSMLSRMFTPLLEKAGYSRRKAKNTEGAQITEIVRDGHVVRANYKTGRSRWFSMHPNGDRGWKPLDGTDALALVTVDDPDAPTEYQLYIFPAEEVRRHLDAGKAAWAAAGVQIGGFGLWLSIDPSEKAHHAAGSGLAEKRAPEATISMDETFPANAEVAADHTGQTGGGPPVALTEPKTIATVINSARAEIAALAGVPLEAVRLDLHIGG